MEKYAVFCGNKRIVIVADNVVTLHNGDFRFYKNSQLIAHFSFNSSWVKMSDDVKLDD